MPTSGFRRHCTHMVHMHTCRQTLILLSKSKENFKKQGMTDPAGLRIVFKGQGAVPRAVGVHSLRRVH